MAPYNYALGEEAVQVFAHLPPKQRAKLLRFCDQLGRRPHRPGDYQETGATGRAYQLELLDDLLVTWWVDDAAREIRILRLEPID